MRACVRACVCVRACGHYDDAVTGEGALILYNFTHCDDCDDLFLVVSYCFHGFVMCKVTLQFPIM